MQAETPEDGHTIANITLLFEAALRAAVTARGLPASCRRRACRTSGACALRYQPWNGAVDRGCNPGFDVVRAAADHVEFLRLLAWIDPEGDAYSGFAAPHMEGDPKLGPRLGTAPVPKPKAWAKAIAAAFGIVDPVTQDGDKRDRVREASTSRSTSDAGRMSGLRNDGDGNR